jgi:Flp pilus assembly CpaE family ATPase
MSQVTVLVIDAEDTSRNFLTTILRNYDFNVVQAVNAREGWQKAGEVFPDIIACDANMPEAHPDEFIIHLRREKRFVHVPIVVFSANPDPEEMERCMQAGGNEYYTKSGSSANTFAKNALDMILAIKQEHPDEDKQGVLAVFISAKGGTGTSSICANTATNLAKVMSSSTVCVVDMVLPIGSQALITGCENDFDIVNVSYKDPAELTPTYLRENMAHIPEWNFKLLCGAPNPGKAGEFNVQHTHDIINALRKAYDYVLVDFGRSLSRISLPIVQEADVAVFVLSNDFSTVTLTKRTLEYLLEQGVHKDRLYPMLNRAVGLEGLTKAEAEAILNVQIRNTVPYMQSNLTLANNQHLPLTSKFPTNTVSLVFSQLAVDISQMGIKTQSRQF